MRLPLDGVATGLLFVVEHKMTKLVRGVEPTRSAMMYLSVESTTTGRTGKSHEKANTRRVRAGNLVQTTPLDSSGLNVGRRAGTEPEFLPRAAGCLLDGRRRVLGPPA